MENENIIENNETMKNIDTTIPVIHKGDVVSGTVISINDNEVMVNIGYMADGIISKEELSYDKNFNPNDIVKKNDKIYVYIMSVSDNEGNVVLSKRRADSIKVWDELAENYKNGIKFEITTKAKVKGGLTTEIKGIRAFIPVSQVSLSYVKNLDEFVNKDLTVKIIEFDKSKGRVVLSSKEVEKEELEVRRNKVWETIRKGEKTTGIVSRIVKFGAFVDLGGVDGLIHISDLSWKRVTDPSQIVKVGDKVEVYIQDVDTSKKRISLALKDINFDPWKNILNNYKIGSVVEGKIVKLTNFGAFVELAEGVEGLVHISEISNDNIAKAEDVLNLNDRVKVKIIDINEEKQKISLSIKDAAENSVEEFKTYTRDEESATIGDLFKDKLKNLKFN